MVPYGAPKEHFMTKTTISTDGARQGRRGGHVRVILVVALVHAAGAWAAAEFYGAAIEPSQPAQSTTN